MAIRKVGDAMRHSKAYSWATVPGPVLAQISDLIELHTGFCVTVAPWSGFTAHIWVNNPVIRGRLIHKRTGIIRIFNQAIGPETIRHLSIHLQGE